MPKAVPRSRTRTRELTDALEALSEARKHLNAINLRLVPNGALKDAVREARMGVERLQTVVGQAIREDAELLRRTR